MYGSLPVFFPKIFPFLSYPPYPIPLSSLFSSSPHPTHHPSNLPHLSYHFPASKTNLIKSTASLCLLVRAAQTEANYRAIYLRERTVKALIQCVAAKYDLSAADRDKVKRAVRVMNAGAVVLRDQDVNKWEGEKEMMVGVRSVGGEGGEWQLEVSY